MPDGPRRLGELEGSGIGVLHKPVDGVSLARALVETGGRASESRLASS
jgi:hypothetical protein